MRVAEGWRSVVDRVAAACERSNRDHTSVRIVAVSKTMAVEKVREAYDAGARIFGENYVQEALPKVEALSVTPSTSAEWHFIGALQSNKAKKVVGVFDLIHSLDRWSLAEALEKARKEKNMPVRALVEVNVAGEASKSGVTPADLQPLLDRISRETEINVDGLMTFPPLTNEPEASRAYFAETFALAAAIKEWKLPRIVMKELSMGVTSDFEVAIEEGATLVRIGTAIFGPRNVIE